MPRTPRFLLKDRVGARGFGHPFLPHYTDKKTGEKKNSAFWWVTYSHNGKRRYLSSHSTKKSDAEAMLEQIAADIWQGRQPAAERREHTLNELMDLVTSHYANDGMKSGARLALSVRNIRKFPPFEKGEVSARKVTTAWIDGYKAWRRGWSRGGKAPASINRELSAISQAYRMGLDRVDEDGRPMVDRMPKITHLKLPPPRQRFAEEHEFQALHAALLAGDPRSGPGDLADLATFYRLTGWRNSEPRSLTWHQVNWFRGTLTLEARNAKNGEPLEYPFAADPALHELLKRRRRVTDEVERKLGASVTWIFHRNGRRIGSFREAWLKACDRIGIPRKGPRSLRPHDFRRARARDLMDATKDPFLTCELVGWKSLDMLARYRITNVADLQGALGKMTELREARQAALDALDRVRAVEVRSGEADATDALLKVAGEA